MDTLEFSGACLTCIEENNLNIFNQLIDNFPWNDSDPILIEKFFIGLLDSCYQTTKDPFARKILDKWQKLVEIDFEILDSETGKVMYKEKEYPDFIVFVACRLYNFPRLLEWIISISNPILTFTDFIYPFIIRNVNDVTTPMICAALDRCFESSFDQYRFLYERSIDLNPGVSRYMKMRMVAEAQFAGIPSYIHKADHIPFSSLIEKWTPEKIPMLKQKDLINYLFEKSKKEFSYTEESEAELKNTLKNNLTKSNIEQLSKVKFWEEYSINNSDVLFRCFGFSNPGDDILDGESICTRFGGHRMLLCNCYSKNDDEWIDDTKDWFTGFCFECGIRIRNRSHVLRLPKHGGGWEYCFCTFKCLKNHIEQLPGECNTVSALAMYSMIRKMQMYLKNNKIFDHDDGGDEDGGGEKENEENQNSCSITEVDIGPYTCRPLKEIDLSAGIDYEKSNLELQIEAEVEKMRI